MYLSSDLLDAALMYIRMMTLHHDRRGKGKHIARAVEAVNLRFTTDLNTSAYKVYVPSNRKVMTSNQVQFNEMLFPH